MQEKREIIDAHHHLWDLSACIYPWLEETGTVRFFGDPTPIQRNYLPREYRTESDRYLLLGSVHIQVGVAAGWEARETQWLDRVADNSGLPSAIVGFCDLSGAATQHILDQHARSKRLRGIRQIIGRSAEEDADSGSDKLLDNPLWIENLRSLQRRDLSFDLQLIPQQVGRVVSVLRTMPELRVALCHCGSPWDQTETGLKDWRAGLRSLASLPNVYCKISGLSMFDHNWDVEDIRPIVLSCIEIFGTSRCMFGSNFPVDKLHKRYDDIWDAYSSIVESFSVAEQEDLFVQTAQSFYRLPD